MPKTARQERLDGQTYSPIAGGSGENNTASNQGSGSSIFYQKSSVDLQFNAVKSENAGITVALDAVSHDVEITLAVGGISLGSGTPASTTVTPLWIDTAGGAGAYKFKIYNGTSWVEFLEV